MSYTLRPELLTNMMQKPKSSSSQGVGAKFLLFCFLFQNIYWYKNFSTHLEETKLNYLYDSHIENGLLASFHDGTGR